MLQNQHIHKGDTWIGGLGIVGDEFKVYDGKGRNPVLMSVAIYQKGFGGRPYGSRNAKARTTWHFI